MTSTHSLKNIHIELNVFLANKDMIMKEDCLYSYQSVFYYSSNLEHFSDYFSFVSNTKSYIGIFHGGD